MSINNNKTLNKYYIYLIYFLPYWVRPWTPSHIVYIFSLILLIFILFRCPKNFVSIHRTHDQDSDADLWRETNILFGKRTGRYLCLSKSEGLPDYIVEKLR